MQLHVVHSGSIAESLDQCSRGREEQNDFENVQVQSHNYVAMSGMASCNYVLTIDYWIVTRE
jgi:hypothetical protein